MSSVSVTINGILWDHASKSGRSVTLVGEASYMGLGVGGGPIMPGGPVDPGYGQGHPMPPHVGGGPMPPSPIDPGYGVPIWPHVGGGPAQPPAYPSTGPVLPPMPEEPPDTSAGGGWVWSPIYGWVWRPAGSGGKPKPPGGTEPPPVAQPT
jgi:hypothetical protein